MVKRHRLVCTASTFPEPELYRPKLLRPLDLRPVFKRHPEWQRRLTLTLEAKMRGEDAPWFPPLCPLCDGITKQTGRQCPGCQRSQRKRKAAYDRKWRAKRKR